ncbi:hypothetical protein JRO89_XS11G0027700 [Xanthoceras sorbifolium]|uniref:Uncharacterized protein n=1 Tax=Xanthoceras sorbifolium TaxID=99658 RepID=A0ABQ8HEF7_9ROSI|nr:hypothetical protein JRO89_XS11G0027700 [Xanthoceras sorbifolium]
MFISVSLLRGLSYWETPKSLSQLTLLALRHRSIHSVRTVASFHSIVQESNPDGVSVTFRCVDPDSSTPSHVEIKHFDGRNCDSSNKYHLTGIASCSMKQNKEQL